MATMVDTNRTDRVEELLDSIAKLAVGMRQRYEDKGIDPEVRNDFLDQIDKVDDKLLSLSDWLEEFPG